MYIKAALIRWLRDRGRAVITDYDLALVVVEFYRVKSYIDEEILVRKDFPEQRDFRRVVRDLLESNILIIDQDLQKIAHRVLIAPDEPAEAILCTADPFLYISHFSAMQRHGLTDRNPVELTLSRPVASLWKRLSEEKSAREFGRLAAELAIAPLPRFGLPTRVRKRALQIHDTRHPGAWQQVRNAPVRVATIGQTFVDMLARPQWCGGMPHVLSVWEAHAETFLEEIIEAVEQSGTKLVKVRAGYILDERLAFRDDRIEQWAENAQRGSSQRLDPVEDYKPNFSEKWMLSINVTLG